MNNTNAISPENSCAFKKIGIINFCKSVRLNVYYFIKRIFDILISMVGIFFILLLSIVIKIIYMLNRDFNSIFFKHKRIGKNGKEIYVYKFRTMVPNAEIILQELLKTDKKAKEEWDKNHKLECDPRITKIGKLLRKTSLDEMPQFINVLIGDMSLIGPRPLIKGELDCHNGDHTLYESVKPGITGWWAAHGRSNTTYEERLELEYFYIKNQSLWLDLRCIFATIKAVICKTGAK